MQSELYWADAEFRMRVKTPFGVDSASFRLLVFGKKKTILETVPLDYELAL